MINVNLKYFYSTIANGNMNTNARFYKEGMSRDEIKQAFTKRRINFGRQNGFNGLKVMTPIQKSRPVIDGLSEEKAKELLKKYNAKYPDGTYVRITQDMIEGYSDFYDIDIYADILMIGKELSGVALAYPVADCPVVFAEDPKNNVVAMAHCGGEYIDRELPAQIIDAIRQETDIKKEEIKVYVGPHAQKENFIYNRTPSWIKNLNVWSGALVENRGYYHIDMETAIRNQLYKQGIENSNITVSKLDTISNPRFYSNNQAQLHPEKAGRFYTGCVYLEEQKRIKEKKL